MRAARLSGASSKRWRTCWDVLPANHDPTRVRPPRPSCDGGGWSSGGGARGLSGRGAGCQHQFRRRRRIDRTRHPAHRAPHRADAGAIDPRHDDVVHPHRGGALFAAHRARHCDRSAQCRDRGTRPLPHGLRDGAGVSARLRHRHPPADQQRDQCRAGVHPRLRAVQGIHAQECAREGSRAVHGSVARAATRDAAGNICCASSCRPS